MGSRDIDHCYFPLQFPLLYLKIVFASITRLKTTISFALQYRSLSHEVRCPSDLCLLISEDEASDDI